MTEQVETGVDFTPAENAFFETGTLPTPEPEKSPAPAEQAQVKELEKPEAASKEEEPKAEKVVPLAALHEERNRRKAIEQRERQLAEQIARYEERFKLVEQFNAPKPPSPEEDIYGAVNYTRAELDNLKKQQAEANQAQQAQAQIHQMVAAARNDAARYASENPDFQEAYGFFRESRKAELREFGFHDPVQLEQILEREEIQFIAHAYQNGVNPAEQAHRIAKARGFKRTAAEQKPSAAEKLATIEQGQAVNRSLASAGGTPGEPEMTAEQLLKMPIDEFEAWTKKNPAKSRRLMGG